GIERWRPITPVVVPAKAGTQYTPRARWLLDAPHARGMTNGSLSFPSPASHGIEMGRPITSFVVPAKAGTQYTPRARWLLDAPHARGMTNERPVLSFRSPACHGIERWRPITPVVVPAKAGTQYTPRAQWLLDAPHARGMTNERPVLSFRSPACHGVERWRPITPVVVP